MLRSKLKILIAHKEVAEGRKITYETLAAEAQLAKNTVNRLAENKTDRIDFATLDKLCRYFDCALGDLLEYVPEPKAARVTKRK